jgi:hypothetical protein
MVALALTECTRGDPTHLAAPVIEIRATDEDIIAPDTVSSGLVHVVFENKGSTMHEVLFVKLPEEMHPQAYLSEVRGGSLFPKGALDYAGPGLTSPGGRVEQWLHLEPGTYLLACWFRGHLKEMPARTLTVTAATSTHGIPPPEEIVIRLRDFRFEVAGQFQTGPQVVRVEATGPSLHEMDLFRLLPGKTLAHLRAWQGAGQPDPAPVEAVGGVLDSHNIPATVWLRSTLRPGRYVLWCGLPMMIDAKGQASGGTHAEAGMFLEFELTG